MSGRIEFWCARKAGTDGENSSLRASGVGMVTEKARMSAVDEGNVSLAHLFDLTASIAFTNGR